MQAQPIVCNPWLKKKKQNIHIYAFCSLLGKKKKEEGLSTAKLSTCSRVFKSTLEISEEEGRLLNCVSSDDMPFSRGLLAKVCIHMPPCTTGPHS